MISRGERYPDTGGIDFAKSLKKKESTADIPVIMLTARGEEADKVRGFEAGIDDYISKPFSIRELIARIHAVLRRSRSIDEDSQRIQVDKLQIEPQMHRVSANGREIRLGPKEFRLLHYLMRRKERVHSREQLLDRVWGEAVYVEERTVDVHIRRLRKALAVEDCDRFIQTIRGSGYRFSGKPV
ncbi:MAG: winged helix-turn-helix domain-containing protein [gamma proteobacterium symbiont of Bathyaustriella thionipta]|nr:winged helix-turn-helix domain-containing protein [gamma proteobacterium symbiont of Bathyaustriella thionipta]